MKIFLFIRILAKIIQIILSNKINLTDLQINVDTCLIVKQFQ